jgi:FkbM family methyltransferase
MPNLTRLAAAANLALLGRLLARLAPPDRAWLARQAMLDRTRPEARALAELFDRGTMAWKNKHYDPALNGEAAYLARLAPFRPRVLMDVGANVGEWALAAAAAMPEATVHAFEIADSTATELRRNAAPFGARIVVNPFGLSDRYGEILLYATPQSPTAASTVRSAVAVSAADHGITEVLEQTARVVRGDAYLAERGIEHVDLLKVDVEGAEFAVFRGLSEAFAQRRIDVVQFEYGQINLATRDFLADFHTFFAGHGYVVGKLFRDGVAFKPYAIEDEDFVGGNYIACRSDRTDLIAAIGAPG